MNGGILLFVLACIHAAANAMTMKANLTTVVPPGLFGVGVIASTLKYDASGDMWYAGLLGARNELVQLRGVGTAKVTNHTVWAVPDVEPLEGSGILNFLLHKSFKRTGLMFVYVAQVKTQGIEGYKNCVFRLNVRKSKATNLRRLWCSPENGFFENGGSMLFHMREGKEYIMLGSGHHVIPKDVQSPYVATGKMLLIPTTPVDSPYNNGFWMIAQGIRNTFRMVKDIKSENIWFNDEGPDCTDELNLFQWGGNYGWGEKSNMANCTSPMYGGVPNNTNQDGPNPILPSYWSKLPEMVTPSTRPDTITGLSFCVGCGIVELEGCLLYATFNNGAKIMALDFTGADRKTVVPKGLVAINGPPVIDLVVGKMGGIYLVDITGAIKKLTA